MPYIEAYAIPITDGEEYYIELVGHKMDGQCVAMAPPSKIRVHERGSKNGGLVITVEAMSQHKAFEMAKLIAECIWNEQKKEADNG